VARPAAKNLTNRETEIMAVLWDLGSATAEAIREALPGEPHDSTVRTHLRGLESKGYVRRKRQGKADVYRPTLPRKKAQGKAVQSLISHFFGGSPEALIVRLLEDENISVDKIDELRRQRGKNK
jgi:BlaI family transcriptional regulator, penicillinase repressor